MKNEKMKLKTRKEIKEMFIGVNDFEVIYEMTKVLFDECSKLDEIKNYYHSLSLILHPDVSGFNSIEIFKCLGNTFDHYVTLLKRKDNDFVADSQVKEAEKFKDIIDKIIHLDNLQIEVIGVFIWLTFEGKPDKETRELIKPLRFKFHPKKTTDLQSIWYYSPEWYRKFGNKEYSLDEIRQNYKSTVIKKSKPRRKRKQLTFTRV